MFDIGFFELLVIAVVGLVVIGPERLPGAIRSGALWWGRIKRNVRETRNELERQLGADDIRRELHNEEVMRSLEALRKTSQNVEKQITEAVEFEDELSPGNSSPENLSPQKKNPSAQSADTGRSHTATTESSGSDVSGDEPDAGAGPKSESISKGDKTDV